MSYSSKEVQSGILIFASVVILLVMTFVIGGYLGGEVKDHQIRFSYVSGLEKGAPVYYAGKEVGKVEKIEVRANEIRPILVTVKASTEILLREDSRAYIDTLGMMGEKFIELTPGSMEAVALTEDAVMEGEDPTPLYELINKMNLLSDYMVEMSQNLTPMVAQLGEILNNEKENIENTIQNVSSFTENLDEAMTAHKEDVAKIVANLHETSSNLRDMTHDLKFRPWRILRKD